MTREEATAKLKQYLDSNLIEDITGNEGVDDAIRTAIEVLEQQNPPMVTVALEITEEEYQRIRQQMKTAPIVVTPPPVPIDVAYAKVVWEWLMDYQMKAAELNGRYSPYEVLSWVGNDWRKEFIEGKGRKNE